MAGGSGSGAVGARGRVRLESFVRDPQLGVIPANALTVGAPGPVLLPASAPRVRISQIGEVAVNPEPSGSFRVPDAVVDTLVPVALTVVAENVPPGTQVEIRIEPEDGNEAITILSDPLVGTFESSTATTAPISLERGFTRFFVTAKFGD